MRLQSTHNFEAKLFPGYKHRLTNGMNGNLRVVKDKNGAKVHVFTRKADSSTPRTSKSPFEGKMITVVQLMDERWTDEEIWAEIVTIMKTSLQSPKNILEIRRRVDRTPETRQLNRVMYAMERE